MKKISHRQRTLLNAVSCTRRSLSCESNVVDRYGLGDNVKGNHSENNFEISERNVLQTKRQSTSCHSKVIGKVQPVPAAQPVQRSKKITPTQQSVETENSSDVEQHHKDDLSIASGQQTQAPPSRHETVSNRIIENVQVDSLHIDNLYNGVVTKVAKLDVANGPASTNSDNHLKASLQTSLQAPYKVAITDDGKDTIYSNEDPTDRVSQQHQSHPIDVETIKTLPISKRTNESNTVLQQSTTSESTDETCERLLATSRTSNSLITISHDTLPTPPDSTKSTASEGVSEDGISSQRLVYFGKEHALHVAQRILIKLVIRNMKLMTRILPIVTLQSNSIRKGSREIREALVTEIVVGAKISGLLKDETASFSNHQTTTSATADSTKRIYGMTDILVSRSDLLSVPTPGAELIQLVEEAKNRGEISKVCDSTTVRRIEGKWMAPQMCKTCQNTPKFRCDRKSPCSTCIENHSSCEPGKFMVTLKAVRNSSRNSNTQPNTSTALTNTPLPGETATIAEISANTPASMEFTASISTAAPSQSATIAETSVNTTGNAEDNDVNMDEGDEGELTAPASGSGKRKADDEDFTPDLDVQGDLDATSSDGAPKRKRRATAATNQDAPNAKSRSEKGASKGTKEVLAEIDTYQYDKPEPYGQPPIWSDKRQGLCETLPWYRAYQSGAYQHDGIAMGFLCDKEVGPRDRFDEQIIITRAGGGRTKSDDGTMRQITDQFKSAIALAFSRAMAKGLPIGVIVGKRNRISPSKMPHYYNVLDWFHVTDVWCEKSEGYRVWMVRLEKINLAERSWWSAKDTLQPAESHQSAPDGEVMSSPTPQLCTQCFHYSKEIYNFGWTCMEPSCPEYFSFEGRGYNDSLLDYSEHFIKGRTLYQGRNPGPLNPPLPTDQDLVTRGHYGVEAEYKRGIVCPKCKCASRRRDWSEWKCENENCDFTYKINQRPVPIDMVVAESLRLSKHAQLDTMDDGIRFSQTHMGLYNVYEYNIPGVNNEIIGFVRHFKANGIINQQPDGPNDLFEQMQERDFGLRRNPARLSGNSGEMLTSHLAANFGAPYKYGVSTMTRAFSEAPPVILKALKRLTWAGEQAVTSKLEPFHAFNELLTIGYFEETHIGYHDDGESTLGPTVATLSLGSSATMCFRPKARSGIGSTIGKRNAKGLKPDVLRITLEHGDIMVMHGPKIQQLYEHAVTPHGKIRFALTCRYVRPETMDNAEEKRSAILKGTIPSGWDNYVYDGDINATAVAQPKSQGSTLIDSLRAALRTGGLTSENIQNVLGEFGKGPGGMERN
ncbi:hypothetical protein B7494_g5055 [Chlorociboria aeruginascens]|nr:hypothetical protein B7494_g5055 [Chlorociboria aeruginascens]